MPVKIYWGPAGSYKTSNAIKNDLPKAALEGRKVVTNVRGLDNTEKCKIILERELKKEIPDSFEVINVPSKGTEGKQKWLTWFHWMPEGVLIIIDEAPRMWPKRLTNKDLAKYDYEGGPDKASEDNRPVCIQDAFDMHRHWNWDMVLTGTHINKMHPEVRQNADIAYRHYDLATEGIKGRYTRDRHDPESTGRNATEINFTETAKKMPVWVFELYKSTKTGEFRFNSSGVPIWKRPKVLMLAFVAFGCLGLSGYLLPKTFARHYSDAEEIENTVSLNPDSTETSPAGEAAPPKKKRIIEFSSLDNPKIYFVGSLKIKDREQLFFNVVDSSEKSGTVIDDSILKGLGYDIMKVSKGYVFAERDGQLSVIKRRGLGNDGKIF